MADLAIKPTATVAAAQRAHYGDVRARLQRGDRPAAPTPSVPTAPDRTGSAPAAIAPAVIPIEIRDVVACVAQALETTPQELLSDLGDTASLGRKIAAALVVRRALLPMKTVAGLIGIAEALVTQAVATLDAVLVSTQASATHAALTPLTLQVVDAWRRFDQPARGRVSMAEIQATVARAWQVSVHDIISHRRNPEIVPPRHVAIYLARHFTFQTLPAIAQAFGGRDHTTVVYAIRKIAPHAAAVAPQLATDASVADWARALRDELGRAFPKSVSRPSGRAGSASPRSGKGWCRTQT